MSLAKKRDDSFVSYLTIIKDKIDNGFYGKLSLNIQDGVIININSEERITVDLLDKNK